MFDITYCAVDMDGQVCRYKKVCKRYVELQHVPPGVVYSMAKLYNICYKDSFKMRIPCEKEKEMGEHAGIYVILENKDNAKAFVDICNNFEGNIDVYQKSTVLDGKSNMGMLSLALNEEICIEYLGEVDEAVKFYEEVQSLVKGNKK